MHKWRYSQINVYRFEKLFMSILYYSCKFLPQICWVEVAKKKKFFILIFRLVWNILAKIRTREEKSSCRYSSDKITSQRKIKKMFPMLHEVRQHKTLFLNPLGADFFIFYFFQCIRFFILKMQIIRSSIGKEIEEN